MTSEGQLMAVPIQTNPGMAIGNATLVVDRA
jgi:hypothetical protein